MDSKTKQELFRNYIEARIRGLMFQEGALNMLSPTIEGSVKAMFAQVMTEIRQESSPMNKLLNNVRVEVEETGRKQGELNISITVDELTDEEAEMLWKPEPCILHVDGSTASFVTMGEFDSITLSRAAELIDAMTVEIVRSAWRPGWVLLVDEDAKMRRKPPNPEATFLLGRPDDFIAGDAIFCPEGFVT